MTFELAVPLERARRDGRADRVAFARLCNVDPDPWQQEVLRSEAHRMHLNCARQTGKSTVCSLLALHRAIYWPNQTVLLISPSLRQSSELQRKVTDRLQLLALRPELDGDSKTVIELANRSRIISLPATESTVRSFTANLIVEDESGDVDDDLHTAILPMLIVSRGRLILAGTPKGQRGHFYEIAKERSAHWEYHRVTVSQNARADVLELEEQRLRLRHLYRQEYECEFIVGGEGMVYGAFSAAEHVIDELPRLEPGEVWRYSLGIDFGFRDGAGARAMPFPAVTVIIAPPVSNEFWATAGLRRFKFKYPPTSCSARSRPGSPLRRSATESRASRASGALRASSATLGASARRTARSSRSVFICPWRTRRKTTSAATSS